MLVSGPVLLCLAADGLVYNGMFPSTSWEFSIDVFAMQNAPEFDDPLLGIQPDANSVAADPQLVVFLIPH
jgi:hypothetical protein